MPSHGRGIRVAVTCAVVAIVAVGCAVPSVGPLPGDDCISGAAELAPDLTLGPGIASHFDYTIVESDIREARTKFGGQPVWLEQPQWPLDSAGEPMQFYGQVALDAAAPELAGSMAYLFVGGTSRSDGEPWAAYSGDNAVVIQPDGVLTTPIVDSATGPGVTVSAWEERDGAQVEVTGAAVDVVETPVEEPAYRGAGDGHWTEEEWRAVVPDKTGGVPAWVQGAEFPDCGRMATMIVQYSGWYVDPLPADAGVLFAFVDPVAREGRAVIQSH